MATEACQYEGVSATAKPVSELLEDLEVVLLQMHDNRIAIGGRFGVWNQLFDKAQRLHLLLRDTPEGRAGITALISHSSSTSRQWAAAAPYGAAYPSDGRRPTL